MTVETKWPSNKVLLEYSNWKKEFYKYPSMADSQNICISLQGYSNPWQTRYSRDFKTDFKQQGCQQIFRQAFRTGMIVVFQNEFSWFYNSGPKSVQKDLAWIGPQKEPKPIQISHLIHFINSFFFFFGSRALSFISFFFMVYRFSYSGNKIHA